jgi:hypothetical protein
VYEDLQQALTLRLPRLNGAWVSRNAAYEPDLCRLLGMTQTKSRYWDATWRDYLIEFKKGRSIWLDLVRYSEILTKKYPDAARKTICLFFIPTTERRRIRQVICVETESILSKLSLSQGHAEALLEFHKTVPRSLNAQASLTLSDVRAIACFIVP